ncbi:MAG: T9SS type A sorting domain-containing protein [Bacteroidales bacterium]|jgi:hypothetical protein|nr:T9SS type A sorting domain-containing protein [Bacteroidales bacterium]
MKKVLIICAVMLSIATFAQFPAPSDLTYSYEYIMIGEDGYCDGLPVQGPTYCFSFAWMAPDTTLTSAILDHYHLYFIGDPDHDTTLVDSSIQPYLQIHAGFIGQLFVTAVYTRPNGESGPSNMVTNDDLPIAVPDLKPKNHGNIHYDLLSGMIKLPSNGEVINQVVLFDNQGRKVRSVVHPQQTMNVQDLTAGLYLIELVFPDQEVIRTKIIK